MAIETKHPTRYAGLVERRLVGLLDEFGWAGAGPGASPVRVMSFSQLSLRRLRQLAPERAAGLCCSSGCRCGSATAACPRACASPARASRSCGHTPGTSSAPHAHGHQVHVWTVDEADDVELCLELGVDAIITNRPAFVRDHAGRRP